MSFCLLSLTSSFVRKGLSRRQKGRVNSMMPDKMRKHSWNSKCFSDASRMGETMNAPKVPPDREIPFAVARYRMKY
jgi:hypothetical protein